MTGPGFFVQVSTKLRRSTQEGRDAQLGFVFGRSEHCLELKLFPVKFSTQVISSHSKSIAHPRTAISFGAFRNLMRVVKSQLSNHYFAQFESMWGLVDPLLKLLLPFVNHARIASLVHPLHTTRYVYTSKFLILFNFHQSALLKVQFLSGICHCQRFSGDSQITRLGVQIPGA